MKILYIIFICISFIYNCSSTQGKENTGNERDQPYSVEKKIDTEVVIKKIATLNAYNKSSSSAIVPTDTPLLLFQSTLSSRIDEIYGSSIEGGDEIITLSKKLKIVDKLDKAIKELAMTTEGSDLSEEAKNTLSFILEKGKIDAIALPVATDGYGTLKQGKSINLYLIVFGLKQKNVIYIGIARNINLTAKDMQTLQTDQNMGLSSANTTVINKTNEFMDVVQKFVKGGNIKNVKESVAKENSSSNEIPNGDNSINKDSNSKEEPKEENLSDFDKYLGTTLMSITAIMWFALP